MAFIPAANVLQVSLIGSLNAQPCINTLYVRTGGPWDNAQWNVLADNLAVLCGALANWQSTDFVWLRAEAVDLTSQTAPTYTRVFTGGIPGEAGSPSLPNSIAFCVSFRSAGRGRSSRGRNYIAGLPEANVTLNTVAPEAISGWLAAYEAFRVATLNEDQPWGVLSRYTNGAPRAAALFQPVTSVVATDSVVDSQRRRLPGRGPVG